MFFPFLLLERKAKNQIIWHQKLLSIITNYEKNYANPIKIKNCRLKSSLVLPNTINQSFYVTMFYNVLKKRIGIKNWDQFSAQVLSPYIKQSNIAFFLKKRGILILDSIEVSILACHAGDRGSIPRRVGVLFFENCWTIKICSVLKNLEVTTKSCLLSQNHSL